MDLKLIAEIDLVMKVEKTNGNIDMGNGSLLNLTDN